MKAESRAAPMLSLAGAARSLRKRNAPEAFPASGAVCAVEVWQRLSREVFDATSVPFAAAGSWREGIRAVAWACSRLPHSFSTVWR